MIRLVRPSDIDTEVFRLRLRQFGELHAEGIKVQACDFLVEVLG